VVERPARLGLLVLVSLGAHLRQEGHEATHRGGGLHDRRPDMEFMQRPAALAPRPRLHLIRLVSA
jgi:hypothetical protein